MNGSSESPEFAGRFFDGQSAADEAVAVGIVPRGLRIDRAEPEVWDNNSFRADVSPDGGHVRIVRIPDSGAVLMVDDSTFALAMSAPRSLASRTPAGRLAVLFVLAACAVTFAVALWFGYAPAAAWVADLLPHSAERALGSAVWKALAPNRERMVGKALEATTGRVISRLARSSTSPYEFRIAITRDDRVNAWAAPGGYLCVYRGLICRLHSGDEFAAVVAHEMAHVAERHSTRNLVRTIGVRLGMSMLLGGGDSLFDTAVMLGALHYMRGDEEAADRAALTALVSSGIEPQSLARAFERLEESARDLPAALNYISTHPPIEQRRMVAENAAKGTRVVASPVLSAGEWRRFTDACGCKARR